MSHHIPEPKIYKHQKLMDEYNEMMIRIKVHFLSHDKIFNPDKVDRYKMPTVEELDQLMNSVMGVLRKDNESCIKH
jgi:hypothetical protein